MIHGFEINKQNKMIHPLNMRPTHGAPCYVTLGENEQYVLSANYGGGSVISQQLEEDGSIGTSSDCIVHGKKDAHRTSHIHTIIQVPHTDYYMATDLGRDKLYTYTFRENNQLREHRTIDMETGSGPRHICFHPTLNQMYIVSEFKSCVYTFTYNNNMSDVRCIQSSPTLPNQYTGENFGADIHINSLGSFLFTSNRGHHSLTTFRISSDGMIDPIAYTPTAGEWPRNFMILPNSPYVIVANEHSDHIVGMKYDVNGELQQVTTPYPIPKPVCIKSI